MTTVAVWLVNWQWLRKLQKLQNGEMLIEEMKYMYIYYSTNYNSSASAGGAEGGIGVSTAGPVVSSLLVERA